MEGVVVVGAAACVVGAAAAAEGAAGTAGCVACAFVLTAAMATTAANDPAISQALHLLERRCKILIALTCVKKGVPGNAADPNQPSLSLTRNPSHPFPSCP